MVCSRSELKATEVVTISALGREFVAFLGRKDGDPAQPLVATVLDVHCPHLGAHLGIGGVLDSERGTLKCP